VFHAWPVAATTGTLLGIEIGGTKLQIVSGHPGRILERHRFSVDAARGAAGIRAQIESTLPGIVSATQPSAVGVGFGGPVDWRAGCIARSHQIEGWSDFELGRWLREVAGVPARVDNDANVAAFGESRHGAGAGANPVFYVTLGSGVGGGLIVDGRIYHGAQPGESEIGHLRLHRRGATVESRCSGWSVDARIRALKSTDPSSALARMLGPDPGGEARHLAAAFPDPAAQRILAETADDLAFALSHVVHLFHPELVVLGGGLSKIGEPLRAAVDAALQPMIMEIFAPGPRVVLSALGEDAVPMGALELAAEKSV